MKSTHDTAGTWKLAGDLASCNSVSIDRQLHSKPLWMCLDSVALATSFALAIRFTAHQSKDLGTLNIHDVIFDKFNQLYELDDNTLAYVVIAYFLFKLIIIGLVVFYGMAAFKARKLSTNQGAISTSNGFSEQMSSLGSFLSSFLVLNIVDIAILVGPMTIIASSTIVRLNIGLKVISLITIFLVPAQLLINNHLTFDFGFVRLNMYQGRSYQMFLLRVLGLWILSAGSTFAKYYPSKLAFLAVNIGHIFLAVALIYLMYRHHNNLHSRFYAMASTIVLSFYVVESIIQTLVTIAPEFVDVLNLDYCVLVCWPLTFFLLGNISQIRVARILWTVRDIEDDPPAKKVLYIEQLYNCFMQQDYPANKSHLIRCLCLHVNTCRNPYCLCFVMKTDHSVELDSLTAKQARIIYKEMCRDSRSNYTNGFIFFNNLQAISALRSTNSQIVEAVPLMGNRLIRLAKYEEAEESHIKTYFIDFETDYSFKLVIASFFDIVCRQVKTHKVFHVALTTCRYLVYEYQNQVAALTSIYHFVNSTQYKRESTLEKDYLFQMLIKQARQQWTSSGIENRMSHLAGLDLSKVLDFRQRVHNLRNVIRDMIIKKIDLYNELCDRDIDYNLIAKESGSLRSQMERTGEEIDILLAVDSRNIKLTREAIVFEICVLEKDYVSAKLRHHYRESLIEMRTRIGSINSSNMKARFSLYNSSNIVVFANHTEGTFKLTRYTPNAVYVFGLNKGELTGAPITDFMPPRVASVHDQLILAYLNGESKSKSQGRLIVPIKAANGNTRSVMLLPKIEVSFFDEVSVAALISIRSKNNRPLIYLDKQANTTSINKRAQKLMGFGENKLNISVYSYFPRLFRLFSKENNTNTEIKEVLLDKLNNSKSPDSSHNNKSNSVFYQARALDQILKGQVASTVVELYYFQNNRRSATQSAHIPLETEEMTPFINFTPLLEAVPSGKGRRSMLLSPNSKLQGGFTFTSEQKYQLLTDVSKILKVRLHIESYHYQQDIVLRELALVSVQAPHERVKNIFKLLITTNSKYLVDFMMLAPDDLLLINRASSIMNRIAKSTMGDSSFKRDQITLKPLTTGTLEQDRAQFQIKVHSDPDNSGIKIGLDVFHAIMKPNQDDISIDFDESISWSYQDATNPDLRLWNTLKVNEVSGTLKKVLQEIKSMLSRDYDPDYANKLIEELNECMHRKDVLTRRNTSPGGTEISPITRREKEKFDIRQPSENLISNYDVDSNSIDQDSHSELKVDYSDPLKSLAHGQQPSTFLKSSSKRSVKETADATTLRTAIRYSHDKLKYRPFLWAMMFILFGLAILKLTLKSIYNANISDIYTFERNVNLISNMLRPASFCLKEASKYLIAINLTLNVSELPFGDIASIPQQDYYIARAIQQLPEIGLYYDNTMESNYTFMAGIQAEKMSMFSMAYSLVNAFLEVVNATRSLKTDFIPKETLVAWTQVNAISQSVFVTMIAAFQRNIDARTKNMSSVFKYMIADYLLNVAVIAMFVFMSIANFKSIHAQVKHVSDRLLIIDKLLFINSLKMIARHVLDLGEEDQRDRKDFRDEIMVHLKFIDHQDSEGSLSSFRKKRRKLRKPDSGSQTAPANSSLNKKSHIGLSFYYNTRDEKIFIKCVMLIVAVLLVNLPSIVNFSSSFSAYYGLRDKLGTSSSTNLASSSSQFIAAILFRRLHRISLNSSVAFNATISTFLDDTIGYLQQAKQMSDSEIQNIFYSSYVCELADTIAPGQEEICIFSSEGNSDYTVFRGLHDIVNRASELLILINNEQLTIEDAKQYFRSVDFMRLDFKTFFQSVSMKIVTNSYMQSVLEYIQEQGRISYIIMSLFISLLFILCCLYIMVYLPWERTAWNQTQDILLVLNDDVLNHAQLKYFFKVFV